MHLEYEVLKASECYYAALGRLLNGDAEPLTQAWSRSPDVTAMNPYGGREVGWEQLQPVFAKVAQRCVGSRVRVWLENRLILVGGDLAYESGFETGEGLLLGEPVHIRHRVTNIYRREADGWKLIHRHTDLNTSEQDLAEELRS